MVNFGIAPYFKIPVEENVKLSNTLIVCFDESLNSETQSCEMDVNLRCWDPISTEVKTRYWDSQFFGDATHQDLLCNFKSVLGPLNSGKISQISMDGPRVNWKSNEKISKEREEEDLHAFTNIGSCSLYIINGPFKIGAKKTRWKLKQIQSSLPTGLPADLENLEKP